MPHKTPFSYYCSSCDLCCMEMIIQVNSYEICRLAQRLSMTTTNFSARHKVPGVHLPTKPGRVCGFLSAQAAPCIRTGPWSAGSYPLARHVNHRRPGALRLPHATARKPRRVRLRGQRGRLPRGQKDRGHSLFLPPLADHSLLAALPSHIRREAHSWTRIASPGSTAQPKAGCCPLIPRKNPVHSETPEL